MIVPYNPSPDLFFGGPSEPEMELYNAGASGHHGLGSTPSELPPHPFPPDYGQYSARHDQSFQCMHSTARRFLPTNLFLESPSRRVHTSGPIRYKMRTQTTFQHTGHVSRFLCNAADRIAI